MIALSLITGDNSLTLRMDRTWRNENVRSSGTAISATNAARNWASVTADDVRFARTGARGKVDPPMARTSYVSSNNSIWLPSAKTKARHRTRPSAARIVTASLPSERVTNERVEPSLNVSVRTWDPGWRSSTSSIVFQNAQLHVSALQHNAVAEV